MTDKITAELDALISEIWQKSRSEGTPLPSELLRAGYRGWLLPIARTLGQALLMQVMREVRAMTPEQKGVLDAAIRTTKVEKN